MCNIVGMASFVRMRVNANIRVVAMKAAAASTPRSRSSLAEKIDGLENICESFLSAPKNRNVPPELTYERLHFGVPTQASK